MIFQLINQLKSLLLAEWLNIKHQKMSKLGKVTCWARGNYDVISLICLYKTHKHVVEVMSGTTGDFIQSVKKNQAFPRLYYRLKVLKGQIVIKLMGGIENECFQVGHMVREVF